MLGVIDASALNQVDEAIEYWIRDHSSSLTKPHKDLRSLAWRVGNMGKLAAAEEMKALNREVLEAIASGMAAEDALQPAITRLERLYKEPPVQYLAMRWAELQSRYGMDLENMRLPSPEAMFSDPFVFFIEEYRHAPALFVTHGLFVRLRGLNLAKDVYRYDGRFMRNTRHEAMAKSMTRKGFRDALETINAEVVKRTAYGVRRERLANFDVTKLIWNPDGHRWIIASQFDQAMLSAQLQHGTDPVVTLDANEIIVPYPIEVVEQILTSIYPLPLDRYTLEGRARGRRARGGKKRVIRDVEVKRLLASAFPSAMVSAYGKPFPTEGSLYERWAEDVMDALATVKAKGSSEDLEKALDAHGIAHQAIRRVIRDWFEQ